MAIALSLLIVGLSACGGSSVSTQPVQTTNLVINGTFTASAPVGSYISATAVKSNGTFTTFTDTSEFAASAITVAAAECGGTSP